MSTVLSKFNVVSANLGNGIFNLNSDALWMILLNAAPSASDTVYNSTVGPPAQIQSTSNAAEIAAGNGYTAGGTVIGSTAYSQVAGLATLTGSNVVFTASGGSIGPFRYIGVYDKTAGTSSTRPVLGWYDFASSISIPATATFTVNISSGILTLQ